MKGALVGATVLGTALLPVFAVVTTVAVGADAAAACLPTSVQVTGSVPDLVPGSARLDAEQRANARTIVSTVVARRLPTRAAVIAVATALQESGLRNLRYGDRDSLGLFQQRPSQGWGAPVQVMDPAHSTEAFLDGLAEVPGWQVMPLAEAAQAVQRSAFPDAYARWEPAARVIVAGLLDRPAPSGVSEPGSVPDTPGLLVLGDELLAGTVAGWPSTFQGGPISVDVAPRRSTRKGPRALRERTSSLPGTIVLSLGAHTNALRSATARTEPRKDRSLPGLRGEGSKKEQRAALVELFGRVAERVETRVQFAERVREVLALAGAERTVYWLTSPAPDARVANEVLHGIDEGERGLQVIDVAAVARKHPGWVHSGSLTPAGASAIAELVRRQVGADPGADPTVNAPGAGCADGLGGYSSVPVADCAFALSRSNPRGCQDAVRWALAQTDGPAVWHRRCLNFVAQAHGWSASGVPTAAQFWATAPDRNVGAVNPPAGALVFWDTGQPEGHVALSAGSGLVISNDINGAGTIAAVPIEAITRRWGATYLGWAPPFFPLGV